MATNWDVEKQDFYNDIKEDGFSVTVRVPGAPGSFNPETMEYDGAVSPVDTTTYGIIGSYRSYEIDGTLIQKGDYRLYVPAQGLPSEITPDHEIKIGSDVQDVVSIKKINPGNVIVGYELQVRS